MVDPKDNLYVTDQAGKVRKFDNSGNFITSFGSLGMADGEFNIPSGIATPNGITIYIADRLNARIQAFTLQ